MVLITFLKVEGANMPVIHNIMPVINDISDRKEDRVALKKLDISNKMGIPAEAQSCKGCGSDEIVHMFGDTPFCSDCYKEFGDVRSTEEERILGIVLELEELLSNLNSWFISPSTRKVLGNMQSRLKEAKGILSLGTKESVDADETIS